VVLAKKAEAPDLVTVNDFLRFHAAAGKGVTVERRTCDSLNTFAEWVFAGFTRVADILTDESSLSLAASKPSSVHEDEHTQLILASLIRVVRCGWT
jgi:hypothetical protein